MMTLANDIIYGREQAVQKWLARGVDLNELDEYGFTPLIETAIANNPKLAALLLAQGADPNYRDVTGGTALHWAAENNNLDLAQQLLAQGADPNAYTTYAQPILVKPLLRGHYKMRELLYQHGGSIDFAQDFINTKLLGHRYRLVGRNYIVEPKGKFIEVDFEGFILEFTLLMITQSLIEFKRNYAAKHLRKFFNPLQEVITAIRHASELLRYQQYQVKREHHQAEINRLFGEQPLVLPVGYEGHAISFVRYGNLLARCDRGDLSIGWFSVMIYQMTNPKQFNKQLLNHLLFDQQSQTNVQAGIEDYLGLVPVAELDLPSQISGNCSWANIEAVLPTLLFMRALNVAGGATRAELLRSKAVVLDLFQQWQTWDRNRALHHCIESFAPASPARKATKAALLGAVLLEMCRESVPTDLERCGRILKILQLPDYRYVLDSYIRQYTQARLTRAGKHLTDLIDLVG